jgi:hypothetical protein
VESIVVGASTSYETWIQKIMWVARRRVTL